MGEGTAPIKPGILPLGTSAGTMQILLLHSLLLLTHTAHPTCWNLGIVLPFFQQLWVVPVLHQMKGQQEKSCRFLVFMDLFQLYGEQISCHELSPTCLLCPL